MPIPNYVDKNSERRQTPRTRLSEIAYIGMGPSNGGLVLDVSDGGLSFHSVAPVQPAETIRFLLSLRGHSRIEGAGQVVWANETKTVCGLKFTSLSSGAREHLNNWTNQTRIPAAAPETPLSSSAPAAPPILEEPVAAPIPADTSAEPIFAIAPAEPEFYLSEPEGRSFRPSPLTLVVIFGLLSATFAVTAFIYGVHVGKSQISFPAPSASDSTTSAEPSASAPNPSSAVATEPPPGGVATSSPGVATSAPIVLTAAPGAAPVNETNTDAGTASNSPPPSADQQFRREAGNMELAAALANLSGDSGKRETAKAVQQLWAAVRKGNARAEVILAGLYVTGDGVAKNCEQARVLLTAAAQSGNAAAKMKLDELKTSGCE